MSGRLNGKKVIVEQMADKLYIHKLSGMEEAIDRYRQGNKLRPTRKPERIAYRAAVPPVMLSGDGQLESILTQSEQLVDDAILEDPRLAKKPAWVRAEEGLDACPALVAAGEERAFFDRRKLHLADSATCEPCRIVISTDSKDVTPDHAAAFIAAARLAQQFRPVEIWWQGAWLIEAGESKGHGFVFLVPLVQGDMDYRRLQFVLSSKARDHASFTIMFSYAWPLKMGWGGGVGPWSYLENTDHFVRESGIRADADIVAYYAAMWAGLENKWSGQFDGKEAEQRWEPAQPERKSEPWKASEADKRRRLIAVASERSRPRPKND
jgi:hypothetical protein